MEGIESPIPAGLDESPALAVVAAAVGADVVADAPELAPEPAEAPAKIFIGGTSVKTTEDMIIAHFSKYGTVSDAILIRNRHTNTPRGFGFVTFADHSALDKVLKEPHTLDGRDVEVKLAVPRQMAPTSTRTRTRRAPVADEGAPIAGTKKVFVGGLHAKVDEETFRGYFEMFGEVVDAVVMFDRQTSRSRGFGFVTFANEEDAQQVLGELHTIMDKVVEVKAAQPKNERRSGGSSTRRPSDRGSGGGYSAYGGSYYREAPDAYGYDRPPPYAYGAPYGPPAYAGAYTAGYAPRGYGGSEGYYPPTSSAYSGGAPAYGYPAGGYAPASGYPSTVGSGAYPPSSTGYSTAAAAAAAAVAAPEGSVPTSSENGYGAPLSGYMPAAGPEYGAESGGYRRYDEADSGPAPMSYGGPSGYPGGSYGYPSEASGSAGPPGPPMATGPSGYGYAPTGGDEPGYPPT